MAKIHLNKISLSIKEQKLLTSFLGLYGNISNRLKANSYFAKQYLNKKISDKILNYEKLINLTFKNNKINRAFIIHGDLHKWNVLYSNKNQVALIDFDDTGLGTSCNDNREKN